jgi:hypothetical protein
MSPNRPYAKLADLWQQDCRVEMVKYKFAAGATASFRRLSPVTPFHPLLKFKPGVAGTMAANGSGVKMSSLRSLALARVLTHARLVCQRSYRRAIFGTPL